MHAHKLSQGHSNDAKYRCNFNFSYLSDSYIYHRCCFCYIEIFPNNKLFQLLRLHFLKSTKIIRSPEKNNCKKHFKSLFSNWYTFDVTKTTWNTEIIIMKQANWFLQALVASSWQLQPITTLGGPSMSSTLKLTKSRTWWSWWKMPEWLMSKMIFNYSIINWLIDYSMISFCTRFRKNYYRWMTHNTKKIKYKIRDTM